MKLGGYKGSFLIVSVSMVTSVELGFSATLFLLTSGVSFPLILPYILGIILSFSIATLLALIELYPFAPNKQYFHQP